MSIHPRFYQRNVSLTGYNFQSQNRRCSIKLIIVGLPHVVLKEGELTVSGNAPMPVAIEDLHIVYKLPSEAIMGPVPDPKLPVIISCPAGSEVICIGCHIVDHSDFVGTFRLRFMP
jgi:hypothetical protein